MSGAWHARSLGPAKTGLVMTDSWLNAIEHVVVLMLENRSLDHMLGYLYADTGNVSPTGQPFEV